VAWLGRLSEVYTGNDWLLAWSWAAFMSCIWSRPHDPTPAAGWPACDLLDILRMRQRRMNPAQTELAAAVL